jgi:hypothetical protein
MNVGLSYRGGGAVTVSDPLFDCLCVTSLPAGAGHGPALLQLARLHRTGDASLSLPPDPARVRYFLEVSTRGREVLGG